MRYGNTPEQPSDDFSFRHIADQDDVIASIRARREASQQEQAAREEASLAHLSPEERARRKSFDETIREMNGEKDDADRKAGRSVSSYSRNRIERDYGRKSIVVPGVMLGAAALAGIIGPGLITDASYGDEKAAQYLEEAGYTDIELTGESKIFVGLQGCDTSDAVKYSFEVTAVNGVDTEVIVCKGMFKGATIRD